MYPKISTEAWVVRTSFAKERDVRCILFTRELGFVWVNAIGLRNGSAKLKGAVHEGALIECDLVKGKEFFRLTDAKLIHSCLDLDTPKRSAFRRSLQVVEKCLVFGEETERLFDLVTDNFHQFKSIDSVKSAEILAVAHLLDHLGYLDKEEGIFPFSKTLSSSEEKTLVGKVNQALSSIG